MGQGGSLSENKSLILGNWVETKTGSNIFFNKVTNQQIQRYEVVINEKNQLLSYSSRMQDQSALICRLIYFHPKSLPKEDKLKKQHMKTFTGDNTQNNRPKSMLNDQLSSYQTQPVLKNNNPTLQQDANIKIYCIYTDRMIPIKQWNKDKIIDVITAFKKLTKIYGMFKVRQRCICQNERKQMKVWINENPISNFPIEYVESQQDMIADLAAILVSKKQKIAKQLLDIQYFDDAIAHFSKLTENDQKKYINSASSSNTASHRQSNTPNMPKQIVDINNNNNNNNNFVPLASQVNNFYNVYINTDNSYTVNSSMQNSKCNIFNQGNYSYSSFSQESNGKQVPLTIKDVQSGNNSINVSQKYKTSNDIGINRQYSVPNFMQVHIPSHFETPVFSSLSKDQQFSQQFYQKNKNHTPQKQNPNQISINKVIRQNQAKSNYTDQGLLSVNYSDANYHQQSPCMDNTSIMIQDNNKSSVNKTLIKTQKQQLSIKKTNQTMIHLQKNSQNAEANQSQNLYFMQNSKLNTNPSKFVNSSSSDLKNRQKHNSSGDIQLNKNFQPQQILTVQSFIQKKDHIQNNSSKVYDKKFLTNGNKVLPTSQSYLKPQTPSNYNLKKVSQFQQKYIDQGRYSEGQPFKYQQNKQSFNRNFLQNNQSSGMVSQSKLFVKSGLPNEPNRLNTNFQSNRNVVSQISTLKPPNLITYNTQNTSQLNKKSFPKYFQDKQTSKSIQKYYKPSQDHREKSQIFTNKNEVVKSPKKMEKVFGQQKFQYKISQRKDTLQEIILENQQSQANNKKIPIYPEKFSNSNEGFIRSPNEVYEQRRKFPSTIECKTNKISHKKSLQEKEFKMNHLGMQIQSQSSYVKSHEGTKENVFDINESNEDYEKILKKSYNTCVDVKDQKTRMMGHSYFSNMNTKNSLLVSNKQQSQKKSFQIDNKKMKLFQFQDKSQELKLMLQMDTIDQNQHTKQQNRNNLDTGLNAYDKDKQIPLKIDDSNRKQTFPHYQQNYQNSRKNQKQFTFYNSSQKPSGLIHIEQINPFEPTHQKNRAQIFKKESLKSADQKQTLPRTTADEKQKRMFKATRTSQILIDTNDLHSSDPGHRIQQIVETLQKEKEKMMIMNDAMSVNQQKQDNNHHPKFKKWQPSVNIYGSIINPIQQGVSIKRKDLTTKSQKNKNQQQSQKPNYIEAQKDQDDQQICPGMISSDNLQTKKKIRKQVFNDYKGLFGDQNPFQKQQTAEEKQKAKRMEIKKIRQQQQRLLQNASSKDLLIQQKVQKQKQKHAQLKSDLSKLFSDEF